MDNARALPTGPASNHDPHPFSSLQSSIFARMEGVCDPFFRNATHLGRKTIASRKATAYSADLQAKENGE
jgi:hypothetical protein